MFHIQTKAYYFTQTILVGGAKYRATGRGFVTQHSTFDENFRFFASSHLYLGLELSVALVLNGFFTQAGQYFGRTWSLWLASISFMAAPFWFNPLTFDWDVVISDYVKWRKWMKASRGDGSKSWSMWWSDENSYWATLAPSSKVIFIVRSSLFILIGYGVQISNFMVQDEELDKPLFSMASISIFILSCIVLKIIAVKTFASLPLRRAVHILTAAGLIASIAIILVSNTNCIRFAIAGYYYFAAIALLGLLFSLGEWWVKYLYKLHDYVLGHVLFAPLFFAAALQVPSYIQTRLLYHNALSTNVVVDDILKYARKNQAAAGNNSDDTSSSVAAASSELLTSQLTELKKVVNDQQSLLDKIAISGREGGGNMNGNGSSNKGWMHETCGGGLSRRSRNESTDALTVMMNDYDDGDFGMGRGNSSIDLRGGGSILSSLDVWNNIAGTTSNSSESIYNEIDGGNSLVFTSPTDLPPR
jgi:callose synthase